MDADSEISVLNNKIDDLHREIFSLVQRLSSLETAVAILQGRNNANQH